MDEKAVDELLAYLSAHCCQSVDGETGPATPAANGASCRTEPIQASEEP